MMDIDNDKPLTWGAFREWKDGDFAAHIEQENIFRSKVIAIDERLVDMENQLTVWLRVLAISAGGLVMIGGLVVSLALWIANDRATMLSEVQHAVITNQKTIERIAATQLAVQSELARQREMDEQLANNIIDILKQKEH